MPPGESQERGRVIWIFLCICESDSGITSATPTDSYTLAASDDPDNTGSTPAWLYFNIVWATGIESSQNSIGNCSRSVGLDRLELDQHSALDPREVFI